MIQIDQQIFQLGRVSPGYFEILKHRVQMYIHIFIYIYLFIFIFMCHVFYTCYIIVGSCPKKKHHKKAGMLSDVSCIRDL